jgi:hypothetical protein
MVAAAAAALAVGVVASAQNLNVKGNITGEGNNYFLDKVGVGTTAPTEKVHITGGGLLIDNMGPLSVNPELSAAIRVPSGYVGGWARGYGLAASTNNTLAAFGGYGAGNTLQYAYIGSSYASPWLVATPAGNVGIGTTAPASRLHVGGDGYALFGPNSTWGARLQVGGNGRVTTYASVVTTNGNLHLDAQDGASATYINYYSQNNTFINAQGGSVGIGTTSPIYKLHVAGDVYANGGWLRTSGNMGWYNETYGGGWYMTDATWIRSYAGKSVWLDNGLGVNNWLGVGTSAPAQKFQVVGGGRYGLGVMCGDSQCFNFNNNGWIYTSDIAGNQYGGVGLAADKFWAAGDMWLGAKGAWLSTLIPNSATTPTYAEVYTDGWFRNNTAWTGLYNQVTGTHWYTTENAYWKSSAPYGIQIRNGYEGAIRGYLYADGTNFGLLSPDGNWKVRVNNSGTNIDKLIVNATATPGSMVTYPSLTVSYPQPGTCTTIGEIQVRDDGVNAYLCWCRKSSTPPMSGWGRYWACI